jgi:hypothetical protein
MRTKQVRPEPKEFEYELQISKQYDKIAEKDYIYFMFKTTKLFESFTYSINVNEKIDLEKKEIGFNIEGLSAPVVSLSKSGNAIYNYKLFGYKNSEYVLKLTKNNKNKSLYHLKFTNKNILLTKKPFKNFVKIIIEE